MRIAFANSNRAIRINYCDIYSCSQMSQSDNKSVTLRSVGRQLTGYYGCEVSADAPVFHTLIKGALITVVGEWKRNNYSSRYGCLNQHEWKNWKNKRARLNIIAIIFRFEISSFLSSTKYFSKSKNQFSFFLSILSFATQTNRKHRRICSATN